MHSHHRVHRSSQVQATNIPGPEKKKPHYIQWVYFCLPIYFSKQTLPSKAYIILLMHNITLPQFRPRASRAIPKNWCTELLSVRNHRYCSTAPALLLTQQPKPPPGPAVVSAVFQSKNKSGLFCSPPTGYFLSQHSAECCSSWCPAAQFKYRAERNPSPAEVAKGWQVRPTAVPPRWWGSWSRPGRRHDGWGGMEELQVSRSAPPGGSRVLHVGVCELKCNTNNKSMYLLFCQTFLISLTRK